MDIEKMYTFIKGYAKGADCKNTLSALYFARDKHSSQKRNGGEPYIIHPLSMVCSAISMGIKSDIVLAAILLHDVVEDCGVKLEDLPVEDSVKEIVRLLTFKLEDGRDKAIEKKIYFKKISENPDASLVKLIDRCNNISTMAGAFKKERLLRYIKETEEMVLPLYRSCKELKPEYSDPLFILKYHIESVLYSIKNSIEKY